MNEYWNPLFARGRVVKKEALDGLQSYPRRLAHGRMERYADGILYGFGIRMEGGELLVSEGAVKYRGDIILCEPETISFQSYGQQVFIKLRIGAKQITPDFERIPYEVVLDGASRLSEGEWELGRFSLSEGAMLRTAYKGVEDCRTPNNTLDLVHVSYAGEEAPTLHPRLVKMFADRLMSCVEKDALDYQFSFMSLNSDIIQRKCILWYISEKLGEPYADYDNAEIYERLLKATQNKKAGSSRKPGTQMKGPVIL